MDGSLVAAVQKPILLEFVRAYQKAMERETPLSLYPESTKLFIKADQEYIP
jgi:hypothetical protein